MNPSPTEELRRNGLIGRRKQRGDESIWMRSQSWLGGRPCIDPDDWPRSENTGFPLHHLAQISIAEIPQGPWTRSLPNGGALCFFLDTQIEDDELDSKVLFVAEPTAFPPANAPSDCPAVGGEMWEYEEMHRSAFNQDDARTIMRAWPLEFVPVEFSADDDGYSASINPPLDEILGPKVPNVHIFRDPRYDKPPQDSSSEDEFFPWDAARRILKSTQAIHRRVGPVSIPSGFLAKISHRLWGKFLDQRFEKRFHAYWQDLLGEQDLFSPMGADRVHQLEKDLVALREKTGISSRYGSGTTTVRDAASEAFKEMMVGSRENFEKIPPDIRNYLEIERRRSGYSDDGRHQIFGIGIDVQGQVYERSDEILLFQADTDDMMSWMWGDVGVLQFWIKPEDLATENWDAVEGTFEGG